MASTEQAAVQELPRTLWVGDVETWMDELYIARSFEGTGNIRNIKILRRANGPSHYAFIELERHEDGAALLAKTGSRPFRSPLGHSFRINWAQNGNFAERDRNKSTTISLYVGALDASVRESDLSKIFGRYPSLSHVKVITDPTTSLSKGFGFVRFRDPADADQALREMQGVVLGSKQIKVRPAARAEARERDREPLSAPQVKAICIGGLDKATQEDCQQLLQRCAAFGATRRYAFLEGCCVLEFQEWAAAEAASSHLQGEWGLPVQAMDAATATYYLQLGQALQPTAETPAITNLTTAKAEQALSMERTEPGLEHFKALLRDPRFVRIFESIRQSQGSQGASKPEEAKGMRWSWLLEDKPEFFGRPSSEFVQQANADFHDMFGGVRSAACAVAPTPEEMRMLCC